MSEERSALGIGRFGVILGCLRASLEVLAKHFIKRFWEGIIEFVWNY